MAGGCDRGNVPSGSVELREFLDLPDSAEGLSSTELITSVGSDSDWYQWRTATDSCPQHPTSFFHGFAPLHLYRPPSRCRSIFVNF